VFRVTGATQIIEAGARTIGAIRIIGPNRTIEAIQIIAAKRIIEAV
jgi:hypothetical protein